MKNMSSQNLISQVETKLWSKGTRKIKGRCSMNGQKRRKRRERLLTVIKRLFVRRSKRTRKFRIRRLKSIMCSSLNSKLRKG
jgi:hypothetical protein